MSAKVRKNYNKKKLIFSFLSVKQGIYLNIILRERLILHTSQTAFHLSIHFTDHAALHTKSLQKRTFSIILQK